MQPTILARAAALCLLAAAGSSHAVSFTQGDMTLDINGTINGFYLNRDVTTTVKATGAQTRTQDSAVGNGLLPGWINFVATTKVDEQDIKAHISFAPGLNNNSTIVGLPNAATPGNGNPYSQIDTRNVYFQFGNASWGRLKFGRDIGLFGQNVILSDMTLLGVGGTTGANIPFNTTFGMIGHGYMYTGFQPQITYSTPDLGGLSAAAGIFQPSKFAGDSTKSPGFQAKVDYDFKGAANGKVWAGLVSQNTHCSNSPCSTPAFNARGFELGAKAGVGDFEALAYGFTGKGLGLSTVGAQFFGGSDGAGNRTESKGYFLQGTYRMGATKLGLNLGQNKDKGGVLGAGNERKNTAYTAGVYHALNKYITLVGEYNNEKVTDSTTETRSRTLSLGGIVFF
ncbi:porin-like protein [Sphaerotilus hippei]|uniref:Porin-like protein n=1 Tax=Sphaerotilus hippei TaxID=744406 RepID=A0A318H333_9BURK|nr:porin [Sphaerotilus hippei]PXW97965.1 porin-like protein [Sphaerotilus hippei]